MYSIAPLKSEEVFVDEGTTEHCSTSNRAHQIEAGIGPINMKHTDCHTENTNA